MDLWTLLLDVVLLLTACLLFGGVAARLKQSPLIGYLLAGMLIGGPGSAKLLAHEPEVEVIAELGVSLLLFSLGLEFSWRRLKGLGARLLSAGALQIVVTATAAALIGAALGLSIKAAVAVGAMLALSSTACCLRVLMDRAEVDSVHGRVAVAVLLVQDLAVVPLAILMNVLSGSGDPWATALSVGRTLLLAALLVAALYLVLNVLAVRALGRLTLERNRELTVLLAVATGLASTWAAHAVGLSPALGAFGAGLFLGGSPFATQIRADVSSLRVVLLTLFFGSAGMAANPAWIGRHLPLVLGVSAAIIVGKTLIIWGIGRTVRLSHAGGVAAGLCLGQIGEFAFVLGGMAVAGGVISTDAHALVVSSAIVTLLVTPLLVAAAPRAGRWAQYRLTGGPPPGDEAGAPPPPPPDVVLIGFGPAARHVAHALQQERVRATVIDLNRKSRHAAEAYGLSGHVGDATQAEVLEHAGVEAARLVVITVPDRYTALLALAQVRHLAPQAHIITRCRYDLHRDEFAGAGAHEIVQDEQQAGHELAARVLRRLANGESQSGDHPGADGAIS